MGCCCSKPFNVGDRITLIDTSDQTIQPAKVISSSANSIKIRYLKYQESAFDEKIPKSEWVSREIQIDNSGDNKNVKHYKQSIDQSELSKVKDLSDYKFTVNQTIKVKDLSNPKKKFNLARVVKVNRKSIKIHWIGEQDDFDETIKKDNNYDGRIIILTDDEIAKLNIKSDIADVNNHYNKDKENDSQFINDVDWDNYTFEVGQIIKCKDLSHPTKKLQDAKVVKVNRKSVKIHWVGEESAFDEVIDKKNYSDRIKIIDQSKIIKEDDDDVKHFNDDGIIADNLDWETYEFKIGQKLKCRDLGHPAKKFKDAKIVKVNKKDIKIHWIGEQDNFDETIKKKELVDRIKIINDDNNNENHGNDDDNERTGLVTDEPGNPGDEVEEEHEGGNEGGEYQD